MTLWFRMYSDVINDPKVMRLPEAMRWHWVAVLCCSAKNDGRVPATHDLAFLLRMNETVAELILTELSIAGLLDRDDAGFYPHNWDGRQFKSDTSTDRVKRFREKVRNVSDAVTETVTVTPPEQSRTETETETHKPSVARPAHSRFDEFWKAYPRRDGPNPRKPAEQKFDALVKTGVDPQIMIDAARKMATDQAKDVGTRFIPMASTWLNQQRWADHAAVAFTADEPSIDWDSTISLFKKTGLWSKWAGPGPDSPACRAPPELLAKHGIAMPIKFSEPVILPGMKAMQ